PLRRRECSACPTRPSVFIPDSSDENPPPGCIQPHPEWQSLNLRLSTPVSSANIAPFTDMHSGLSHANDASFGVPGITPRRSGAANRRNRLQTGAPPRLACAGAHAATRRLKTKTSALPPPRVQPIRPLIYSEQTVSRLDVSGLLWGAGAERFMRVAYSQRRPTDPDDGCRKRVPNTLCDPCNGKTVFRQACSGERSGRHCLHPSQVPRAAERRSDRSEASKPRVE
ncbi:MAG: hypothetical protein QOG58_5752, partial [Caballeronia sp.]|nr:hypothetical protein [Caballeronia sp.]